MNIKVNGEARQLDDGSTVREVIAQLGIKESAVAVELNRKLLKSDRYDTQLNEGDELELVTFVGGG